MSEVELVQAEAHLLTAEAALAPLDRALVKAQAKALADYEKNRAAILAAVAVRDPARIEVMNAQDRVADLRAGLGIQPPTIGKADR